MTLRRAVRSIGTMVGPVLSARSRQPRRLGLALAACLFAFRAQGQPMFVPLGDLSGGTFQSEAAAVSADGSTIVGGSSAASGYSAARWTSEGALESLGDLPGGTFNGAALGVSADGSTVVGRGSGPSGNEAFRWTNAGGMVGLGDLPGGVFASQARGVSADGSTVVGYGESASGREAFRWTNGGGMVGLGDFAGGGFQSTAHGVSADGSVIVGTSTSASGSEAFRWTSGDGMVALGDLPGGDIHAIAYGVSPDGSTIVGTSSVASGFEAFRWTSGGGTAGLGELAGGGFDSRAYGASANGSVIVGSSWNATKPGPFPLPPMNVSAAFVWDAMNGMRDLRQILVSRGLSLDGWELSEATGISADGRVIVGYGKNPGGQREAWLAVIASCSDGLLEAPETCDDANSVTGDGCSAACTVEVGWSCNGQPSVCTSIGVCGDGAVEAVETCDDGGIVSGDGCSDDCAVESGWQCAGSPSACTTICGDGLLLGTEECDDLNAAGGDGCTATCTVEGGWNCNGQPSSCSFVGACGDAIVAGVETCDDGDLDPGDGCSDACDVETGWACMGSPSTCSPICGDGLVTAPEACDDGAALPGDGCSDACLVEPGFECAGAPSVCTPLIPDCDNDLDDDGDGLVDAAGGPLGELPDPGCLGDPGRSSERTTWQPVASGEDVGQEALGGPGVPGGIEVVFSDTDGGVLGAEVYTWSQGDPVPPDLPQFDFLLVTNPVRYWQLEYTGSFDGPATVTFTYDPADLAGFPEDMLRIFHFRDTNGDGVKDTWLLLPETPDVGANTITVTVPTFSPFLLGGAYPCADGIDNDGDTLVDFPADPGCASAASRERAHCQDGLDNDGQTGIDFDGGASLDLDDDGFVDAAFNPATPAVGAADPECGGLGSRAEKPNCGLGAELALLLPLLGAWRRRRSAGAVERDGMATQ